MGLRRFKVFYCTINPKAILGDNTVKMPGIPAYREFSNKGLRGGMEFNSFAKQQRAVFIKGLVALLLL